MVNEIKLYNKMEEFRLAEAVSKAIAINEGTYPGIFGYVRGRGHYVNVGKSIDRAVRKTLPIMNYRIRANELLDSDQRDKFISDVNRYFSWYRK